MVNTIRFQFDLIRFGKASPALHACMCCRQRESALEVPSEGVEEIEGLALLGTMWLDLGHLPQAPRYHSAEMYGRLFQESPQLCPHGAEKSVEIKKERGYTEKTIFPFRFRSNGI